MIENGRNVAGEVGDELIMRGEMEELLSLQEVAEYLQVSIRHLLNLRSGGSFPSPVKVGKSKILFRKNDINQFIQNGGVV